MLKALLVGGFIAAAASTAAFAQTPRQGGTLNHVAPYGTNFSTLDAHATPNVQDEIFTTAIHRSLYQWDPVKSEPVLELATDVKASDDGLVFTYKLRDDAVFHNGKPLTADDIIWSYQRVASPANAFPGVRYLTTIKGVAEFNAGKATSISGLRKIDDHTLEITFTEPTKPGYALMRVQVAIYPSNLGEKAEFATKPIGIGPFKFVEHVPGSRAVVERFDRFYRKGQPYLDRINLYIMGDAAARDVAFRNKEIDLTILGPAQYQAYKADPALSKNILEVAEIFTRHLGFNLDLPQFQDRRVRQAINYAINSKLIIERLARNKAYPAVSWLPPSSPAFDKAATPYTYDPAKARTLLAEAGMSNGFEFTVNSTPNESWGTPIVEAIIPMLAQVGIKVRPRPVDSAMHGEMIYKGQFDSYIWSGTAGPDPLFAMQAFYSKNTRVQGNYTAFRNPEFDKLFEAARAERDVVKQNEILRQANNLVMEEAPVWFFNYSKGVMAFQPWVHGLKANANELAFQTYEDIWIDETAPASRR